ncbi:MAG: TRAP transporter large permease [Burkholderiaceae bacterium]
MTPEWIGVLAMGALFALIMLRVPVAIAMGVCGLVGYAALDGWEFALLAAASTPYDLTEKYALSVVPLFILMGVVATRAGMSQELYRATNAIFSGMRGALAMGTVGACAGFGAICGSSLATAATMTPVAVPQMRRHGYDDALATGVVASAGILGVLIPPSVVLVVYAIIAEQGVPQLFAAALLPGLLGALLHLLVVAGVARWQPERVPTTDKMTAAERLGALVGLWKMALLFAIAVGGIYSGLMSPTESAAVAALVAIVIGLVTRTLSWRALSEAFLETIWTTGQLFIIIVGAFLFAYFIALTQLTVALSEWVQGLQLAPIAVIGLIIVFYLILGFFLDAISMLLITVPVFLPLAESVGYDPIWFGILILVAVEVGMITPPVGLNIFVVKSQLLQIDLMTIYRGIVPFLFAHAALIVALLIWPGLALFLPGVLY